MARTYQEAGRPPCNAVAFVTLNCCCTSYLIILESRSNLEPESRVVQEEKNLALKQYLQYLQYHMHLPRAPPPPPPPPRFLRGAPAPHDFRIHGLTVCSVDFSLPWQLKCNSKLGYHNFLGKVNFLGSQEVVFFRMRHFQECGTTFPKKVPRRYENFTPSTQKGFLKVPQSSQDVFCSFPRKLSQEVFGVVPGSCESLGSGRAHCMGKSLDREESVNS